MPSKREYTVGATQRGVGPLPVRTIVITLLACALVGWVAMAPGAAGAPRAASSPQVMCPPAVGPDYNPYELVPPGTPGCGAFNPDVTVESASSDGRTRITPTTGGPWRWITYLDITASTGAWQCTGYLVGPHSVFTAGHCLYNPQFGGSGYPSSIRVVPGKDGSVEPYGSEYGIGYPSADWVNFGYGSAGLWPSDLAG